LEPSSNGPKNGEEDYNSEDIGLIVIVVEFSESQPEVRLEAFPVLLLLELLELR